MANTNIRLNQIQADGASNGQFLKFNGAVWLPADMTGSTSAAGSDYQVQFKSGGAFAASDAFQVDPVTKELGIGLTGTTSAILATVHAKSQDVGTSRVILAQNSNNDFILSINSNGYLKFGNNETYPRIYQSATAGGAVSFVGNGLTVDTSFNASGVEDAFGVFHASIAPTGGGKYLFRANGTFAPTSGSALYTSFISTPTINQTSTANGTITSFTAQPTLTSLLGSYFGFYVDVSNSSAWGFYQFGANSKNYFNGSVAIGANSTPDASAILDANSTTKGFLPPRMSTTERNAISSPSNGLMLYNNLTHKLTLRENGAWVELGSGGGLSDGNYGDIIVSSGGTALTIDASVVGNTELASGVGGFYKGSGIIAAGAVSTLTNSFAIRYATGGTDALLIDDTLNSVILQSKDATQYFYADNTSSLIGSGTSYMEYRDGVLRLWDSDLSQYIGIQPPATGSLTTSYTLVLPNAAPVGGSQIMSFNVSGMGAFVDRIVEIEMGVSSTTTITTGAKGRKYFTLPAGDIVGWSLVSDQNTNTVVDIWKANGSIPTNANTITASAKPTLTAASLATSTTLTGWTVGVAQGDVFILEVESNSAATYLHLVLRIKHT